jgi:hypothetical protein
MNKTNAATSGQLITAVQASVGYVDTHFLYIFVGLVGWGVSGNE